jgi:uncharacterized protein YjbJ (UPF0337 family)
VTRDRIVGGLQQFAGVIEQGWGWLVSDETLRMRGVRDRRIGRLRQRHDTGGETTIINRVRGDRG